MDWRLSFLILTVPSTILALAWWRWCASETDRQISKVRYLLVLLGLVPGSVSLLMMYAVVIYDALTKNAGHALHGIVSVGILLSFFSVVALLASVGVARSARLLLLIGMLILMLCWFNQSSCLTRGCGR
jgi:hypothetical protein